MDFKLKTWYEFLTTMLSWTYMYIHNCTKSSIYNNLEAWGRFHMSIYLKRKWINCHDVVIGKFMLYLKTSTWLKNYGLLIENEIKIKKINSMLENLFWAQISFLSVEHLLYRFVHVSIAQLTCCRCSKVLRLLDMF